MIVVALLSVTFYVIFNRPERLAAGENPLLELFFGDEEGETGEGILSASKKFIDEKLTSIKDSVKESVREKEEEVLTSLKKSTNEAIDAAQEKIVGIEEKSGSISVLQTVKTDTSAYFLISNPDPSLEIEYEIDWGDGSVEKGVLSGGSKTVSHLWNEEGEFLVNFKTLGSDFVSGSIKVFVTR